MSKFPLELSPESVLSDIECDTTDTAKAITTEPIKTLEHTTYHHDQLPILC